MLGLVDYGSGSDSDSDGEQTAQPTLIKNVKPPVAVLDGDFFDEDIPRAENTAFNLPSAAGGQQKVDVEEAELEGAVKPRDWELQMAEENKKKLEKRAKKKDKKEKKKKSKKDKEEKKVEAAPQKPKVKAKISAFGALAALDNDSDSDDEPAPRPSTIPAPSTTNGSKIGLFSMLPAPKAGKAQDGKAAAVLLPPSLRKKTTPAPVPKIAAAPTVTKRKADSDDSDDGDDVTDFFGLSAAPEAKQPRMDDVPMMPSTGFGEAIGPSKPPAPLAFEAEDEDDQFDHDAAGPSHPQKARKGFINDEMVYNMLARDETVQTHDKRSLHEIAAGIIDVNVDQALGPNLQGNLLKNITRAAGSMKMPANLATSKDPSDKMARQKHQLSYLAKLAVSRDAALQEQWASSRNQKKMGREKYGF